MESPPSGASYSYSSPSPFLRCHEQRVSKYYLGDHSPWVTPDGRLDLQSIMRPDSYNQFVTDVRRTARGIQSIRIAGDQYVYSGRNAESLDGINGRLRERWTAELPRIVFVPSKGRSDNLIEWPEDLKSTMSILLVPNSEHELYSKKHGWKFLILSNVDDPEHTIGRSRYNVLRIARFWDLDNLWMVDDSLQVNRIRATKWDREGARCSKNDLPVTFEQAMKQIEDISKRDNMSRIAQVGIPSTYSVRNLARGSDIGQVNERAPTSFVFVRVWMLPCEVNYDPYLPFKEDIIFSQRVLLSGLDVMVYRGLHVHDARRGSGGCNDPLRFTLSVEQRPLSPARPPARHRTPIRTEPRRVYRVPSRSPVRYSPQPQRSRSPPMSHAQRDGSRTWRPPFSPQSSFQDRQSCAYCRRHGHTEDQCHRRHRDEERYPRTPICLE